jgi:hypothetical protein
MIKKDEEDLDIFRRIAIAFLCGLLAVSFTTSVFAQGPAPEKPAPAAAYLI